MVLHVGLPKTGTTYLQAAARAAPRRAARARRALPVREAAGDVPGRGRGAGEPREVRAHRGRRRRHLAGALRPGAGARRPGRDQPRDPRAVRARRDRPRARAAGRRRPRRRRHRTRPGPAGGRALAGGGQARRHPVVRRASSATSSAPTSRDGPDRPHFWHAQDYAAALGRWSTAVPAHRVHLVVVPPPGAAPDVLWRGSPRRAALPDGRRRRRSRGRCPGQPRRWAPRRSPCCAGSTPASTVALTPREHARLVKRGLAEGVLADGERDPRTAYAGRPGRRTRPGDARLDREIASAGHPVHGDAGRPGAGAGGSRRAAPPRRRDLASVATAALAAELAGRAADQRADSQRVDSGHERTGAGGRTAVPARCCWRLRRRLGVDRD